MHFYLIFVVLILMLVHLYIFTKSITLKYELTDMKIKYRELKSQSRFLSSQISRAESLDLIEAKAKSIGMDYPESVNYIIMSEEVK